MDCVETIFTERGTSSYCLLKMEVGIGCASLSLDLTLMLAVVRDGFSLDESRRGEK